MILRKPFAFFIKIFKPIHIIMAICIGFLIYKTNRILSFFNSYIYSNESVVGQSIKETLVSNDLYIIPIILIVFSLIFIGIMFNKKKPITFYVVNVFAFLVVIVISAYFSNFLSLMEEAIISIKLVKLNHDLVLINIIIEVVSFIFILIRGLGINFKKFNFDSDISKFDINDSDKEEFELNINVDIDNARRKRKKSLRHFKYIYIENKLIINLFISILIVIMIAIPLYFVFNDKKENTQGFVYNISDFNIIVNKTLLLKESFSGKKLTEDYIVAVDFSLQSYYSSVSLFKKDFKLEIEDVIFSIESKYQNDLLDLGNLYNEEILTENYNNYLLIFEIPEKYIETDMYLTFNNQGVKTKIKLSPQNLISNNISITKQLGETLEFNESLGKIDFKISSYEIKDKFLIKYNYCVKEDNCLLSKEYIKPTLNENFDKIVMKLSLNYNDNSSLNFKKFYDIFSRFGSIYYKLNDKWYYQNNNFEELKSNKVDNKNNVYIGINSNIMNSEEIKLVFNIRNSKYEYVLK